MMSEKRQPSITVSGSSDSGSQLEKRTSNGESSVNTVTYTDAEVQALYRKLDKRLLPMLGLLYLLAFMDRGNIGNAKLEGLLDQLHMSSGQYSVALIMFFIPYCVFEPPSNIILKLFRPSIYIPIITLVWGVVMTLMGLVKTYPQLVGARVCLGAAEAGLFPGVVYFLTFWYPREKLQFRIGMFFGAATIAGAFSGLLAYGISFLDGKAGLLGWSWIFILEGIATCVASFLAFFVLHGTDYPEEAKFLTPDERAYIIAARNQSAGTAAEDEHYSRSYIFKAIGDWQVIIQTLNYMSVTLGIYSCALFLPSIIRGFGYDRAISQLLTIPPFFFATIVTLFFAYFSDRLKFRSPFVLAGQVIGLIGFVIISTPAPSGVKYFAMFLCTSGVYAAFPGVVAWLGNNLAPSYKRGFGMAIQIGIGNFAGAIAAGIYQEKDAPAYLPGNVTTAAFLVMGLFTTTTTMLIYKTINKKRETKIKSGYTETAAQQATLGDRSVNFRYIL